MPEPIIFIDDVVPEGSRIPPSITSFEWDLEMALPDGTDLRSKGLMISTPLRKTWIK